MLKEKQISSFGKAFLSKKRFVEICVILWSEEGLFVSITKILGVFPYPSGRKE